MAQKMDMGLFFEAFLKERARDFRRISSWTRGEMSAGDLQGEAWLLARKIGKRQKREFDFSDPADQEYILGALYNEFIKWGHHALRFAISLDREYDDEDGAAGYALMNSLVAQETSDPLVLLERHEALVDDEWALASSYSQAAAYAVVFDRFDLDHERICDWLAIADSTLTGRVRRALETVRMQASLFDRVESIPDDFMPMPGRERAQRIGVPLQAQQVAWAWF